MSYLVGHPVGETYVIEHVYGNYPIQRLNIFIRSHCNQMTRVLLQTGYKIAIPSFLLLLPAKLLSSDVAVPHQLFLRRVKWFFVMISLFLFFQLAELCEIFLHLSILIVIHAFIGSYRGSFLTG